MIVLDTNVVSEVMKTNPSPRVKQWFDGQHAETLFLTTITIGEILTGIEYMPAGKRKETYRDIFEAIVALFPDRRVLPYDKGAAHSYALILSQARQNGRAIGMADGQIAAIAKSRGFSVATRDVSPFEAADVPVINPWQHVF
jgi:toxin FitB